jgi:hypothetical protein
MKGVNSVPLLLGPPFYRRVRPRSTAQAAPRCCRGDWINALVQLRRG